MSNVKCQMYQRGQAAITSVFMLVGITLSVAIGFSTLALNAENVARKNIDAKAGYYVSESGQEDIVYRFFTGRDVSDEEVISVGGRAATSTVAVVDGETQTTSRGQVKGNVRRIQTAITVGDQVTFYYGMQAGEGGILMENQSGVIGNVYSNGPVVGQNENVVRGSVVSAGPEGLIEEVYATSSARAHTIRDSVVDGDAYYQVISNTTVGGTEYPGSEDMATSSLAISDAEITDWENDAAAGGTLSCNNGDKHVVEDDATLGPVKIPCGLVIKKSPTVTLAGAVWVVGDISIENSASVVVSSSIPTGVGVPLIADDPADRLNSSTVEIKNTASFSGNGDNSYILVVSQHEGAETGGGGVAIDVSNQSDAGDLLIYAAHGEILIQNKGHLREVSAYEIHLENQAMVEYETGVQSPIFQSGPGSGYDIVDWKEIE